MTYLNTALTGKETDEIKSFSLEGESLAQTAKRLIFERIADKESKR